MDFKEYKSALWLIAKFFIAYIILTIAYSQYLQPYLEVQKVADPFTAWVSESVSTLMNTIGFNAETQQYPDENYMRFYLEGNYSTYINEGCNALSIMIIYVSLIIAFSQKWLSTALYALGGVVLLNITNIFRIALLNYIVVYHNDYTEVSHDVLFPVIIYGMVVILWIIWIKFFVFKKKK